MEIKGIRAGQRTRVTSFQRSTLCCSDSIGKVQPKLHP